MFLPFAEQTILSHIQNNRAIREFWDGKIAGWRAEGKTEDEVIAELEKTLPLIYMGDEETREDLEGLVDTVSLMTANYTWVAFAMLGRDFRLEAVAFALEVPKDWPEPYQIDRAGKALGPYSYAEVQIKWTDGELTADDKVLHPSGQWRSVKDLAEPWTMEGWVAPQKAQPTLEPPAQPVKLNRPRTKGTEERPLPIAQPGFAAAAYTAALEIDSIFGKGQWELAVDTGVKDGIRCWMIKPKGEPIEAVWIEAPALAKEGIGHDVFLEWITQRDLDAYRARFESPTLALPHRVPRLSKPPTPPAPAPAPEKQPAKVEKENDKDHPVVETVSGCGCLIIGLIGLAILIFANSMATRVWTVVGVIVAVLIIGSISVFLNKLIKYRAKKRQ